MPKTNPKADNLPSQLGFKDLVKEANSGSPEALAQLRHVLDDNPQIWRAVGNLALHRRESRLKFDLLPQCPRVGQVHAERRPPSVRQLRP